MDVLQWLKSRQLIVRAVSERVCMVPTVRGAAKGKIDGRRERSESAASLWSSKNAWAFGVLVSQILLGRKRCNIGISTLTDTILMSIYSDFLMIGVPYYT